MSLIHEALKEMDRPAAANSAAWVPAVSAPARRGAWLGLLAFAAVLAVGAAAYAGWRMLQAAPPPMAVAVAAPPAPSLEPAAAPVPAQAPTLPSAQLPESAPAPAVPVSAPAAAAVTIAAASSPPAAPAARPAPRGASARAVVPRAAQAPKPPEPEVPVEQRFGLFLQAMRAQDLPQAEQQLAGLRRQLTRGSVSLLRAEAWYAMARGDTAGAVQNYRDILERLPGDEEASINYAAIEARQQRTESARQILAEALRQHPESEPLASALAAFGKGL